MRPAPEQSRHRVLLLGAVALAAYAVAAVATLGGGNRVRPLYDGFTPPPPYRWVKPPREFAAGNAQPTPVVVDMALAVDGSAARGVATDDGQFVLNLPPAAVSPRDGETGVNVEVTPLDPALLGRLPAGLHSDGNAYRATLAYQPSGQPVGPLARSGNLVMGVPEATQVLLYSPDGQAWTRLATRNLGGPVNPDASFDQAGYYLGAAPATAAGTSEGSSGTGDRVVAAAVITVAVAVGLWFLPAVARRVRRR